MKVAGALRRLRSYKGRLEGSGVMWLDLGEEGMWMDDVGGRDPICLSLAKLEELNIHPFTHLNGWSPKGDNLVNAVSVSAAYVHDALQRQCRLGYSGAVCQDVDGARRICWRMEVVSGFTAKSCFTCGTWNWTIPSIP